MRPDVQAELDILHITSAHPVWDTRIFVKEARTLAQAGYRVAVVGPGDHVGQSHQDGVGLYTLPRPKGRAGRFFKIGPALYRFARKHRPRAVHLHDPDLLLVGYWLHRRGIRVVYDVHEDFPLAILSRSWLGPHLVRQAIAAAMRRMETWACGWLAGIVLADRQLQERFPPERSHVVRNYLEPSEWLPLTEARPQGAIRCIYVGDITLARGLMRMCDAIAEARKTGLDVHLDLVGPIREPDRARVMQHVAAPHVKLHGRVRRSAVATYLAQADIAFALMAPTPAYKGALGVKILEYIGAGLPILATDMPRLRSETPLAPALHLVDWYSPTTDLAKTLRMMATTPYDLAKREALRKIVMDHYSWPQEGYSLKRLYKRLLD